MSIGFAYVRCWAALDTAASTIDNAASALMAAARNRKRDASRPYTLHLQPATPQRRGIGDVHPPPLDRVPERVDAGGWFSEPLPLPLHARDFLSRVRVTDDLDRVAGARPRSHGGRVGGNHGDARWMQDHHPAVGMDPRSGVDASDTVRIRVGFAPQGAALEHSPIAILAAFKRTGAVNDVLLVEHRTLGHGGHGLGRGGYRDRRCIGRAVARPLSRAPAAAGESHREYGSQYSHRCAHSREVSSVNQ